MGKVKTNTLRIQYSTSKTYQFPMGKVKFGTVLGMAFIVNSYQFPMGKVKSAAKNNDRAGIMVSIPYGKGKGNETELELNYYSISINSLWER